MAADDVAIPSARSATSPGLPADANKATSKGLPSTGGHVAAASPVRCRVANNKSFDDPSTPAASAAHANDTRRSAASVSAGPATLKVHGGL